MSTGPPYEAQTVTLDDMTGELRTPRFAIAVSEGPQRGTRVVSAGDELSIGTSDRNSLVLQDRTASRHHCRIVVTSRGFELQDLASRNGTRIAGLRIGTALLKPGASFTVGRSTLSFERVDGTHTETVSRDPQFGDLVGKSAAMRRLFAFLPRIAASEATVLIEGETGTGKGAVADAIHRHSARAQGPFVVVDCASVTPTLIESYLFGHDKGAFTGAHAARIGAFEAASGGTIFLDEVGELPLELQPKLLRVLEERTVSRLGRTSSIAVDARVVAATNRDLRSEVNAGTFRSDLFYRLNVVSLRIPALRDRRDDITELARLFWAQRDDSSIPPDILTGLTRQRWPGNVRELRAAVERAVLFGPEAELLGGGAIDANSGAVPVDLTVPFRAAKGRVVGQFERRYLSALIEQHDGNLSHAARAARIDRNYLRELLQKHDLR